MIPVNLFTGFLGVGKTTAVLNLLKTKPATEHWAVLVNEYGDVGLDAALMEGEGPTEGISIREVAGGCVCCAAAPYLPVALHFLLQERKPDRLLFETTGLGHPARLLDLFRTPAYKDRFTVKATIGLVAPADFTCPGMRDNPIFQDQIHLADVLVLNKQDRATPEVVAQFSDWAQGLYPPKWLVAATEQGRLNPAWLDFDSSCERAPMFPGEHPKTEPAPVPLILPPRPGKPTRHESPSGNACGWIFHPDDEFDEDQLLALFQNETRITRWKGVFRVNEEWISANAVNGAVTVKVVSYRRDSRVEVFAHGVDWKAWELTMLNCRVKEPSNSAPQPPIGNPEVV
jgi:G3E family GTPase